MAEPFLSEIRIMSFNFPPKGWALCNGQLLPINQNQALFALMGTTYGGNGQTNFALPNLQGRAPVHMAPGFTLGQNGGEVAHTLSGAEADHAHALRASGNQATATAPGGAVLAVKPRGGKNIYQSGPGDHALDAASVSAAPGGGQPHENMQPYLVLNFVIALQGIFPPR
jgi:microcystin-dependent protein